MDEIPYLEVIRADCPTRILGRRMTPREREVLGRQLNTLAAETLTQWAEIDAAKQQAVGADDH